MTGINRVEKEEVKTFEQIQSTELRRKKSKLLPSESKKIYNTTYLNAGNNRCY